MKIFGHDKQLDVLRRNIRTGMVPPAYLFHGDEGIGKRLAAVEFAKAVNCLSPDGLEPCGSCRPCRNIDGGCHPNVQVLALEANPDTGKMRQEIVVSQVRAAQDFLSLKAVGEGRKVLIADDAHLLNEEAENAFLKTLEEPPDNSHVILVTSRPGSLLPTIISRCRALSFQPLPEDVVAGLLVSGRGLSAGEAAFVAAMTGGRVGEALSADAADLAARREDVLKALSAIAGGGPGRVLKEAEDAAKGERALEDIVFFGGMWFRDLLIILVGGEPSLAYNKDISGDLSDWARGVSAARCEEALEMLRDAGRALGRTFNRRLLAEDLFFRLREEVLA